MPLHMMFAVECYCASEKLHSTTFKSGLKLNVTLKAGFD